MLILDEGPIFDRPKQCDTNKSENIFQTWNYRNNRSRCVEKKWRIDSYFNLKEIII